MGKGGGGALSMWIREFTSLVFTQTIQAFIYTIIISVIMYGMINSKDINGDDHNASMGLMATFALLSVFKVEEMSKRIFGIHDTKASPGNAMRSIAKTAFAAHLGKRVMDNLGKVTGGVGAWAKSGQDRKKLAKRMNEDMADNGFERGKNGKLEYVGKAKTASGRPASQGPSAHEGNPSPNLTDESDLNGNSRGRSSTDNYEISATDRRRMRNALRSYEEKAAEINKQRNEGIKNIFSGITETASAGFFGTAGMVLGGADGNIDEAIQGILAGAGVGDTLGQSAVNAVDRATKFVQRNYKRDAGISSKELQKSISAYKDALNKASVNYNSSNVDDIE